MSKVQTYDMKLRGDFKRYLVKIACNKSDSLLTEGDVLKAFDLAVQKQKLTTLEAEMLECKHAPVEKSKIDILSELNNVTVDLRDSLECLASWPEGDVVDSSFDEPSAASTARGILMLHKEVLQKLERA